MHADPTPDQVEAFTALAQSHPEPVFMLNLLRFAEGGEASYGRYAATVGAHVKRVGGQLIWAGACSNALIGPSEGEWDLAAVVRYPSRAAFLEMVGDPGYLAIAGDRTAALADSRLIPCDPVALDG